MEFSENSAVNNNWILNIKIMPENIEMEND